MNWKKIELMLLIISGFAVYFAECGIINNDRVIDSFIVFICSVNAI